MHTRYAPQRFWVKEVTNLKSPDFETLRKNRDKIEWNM